jgi:NitT/TauT family transport system substrate-binding protein
LSKNEIQRAGFLRGIAAAGAAASIAAPAAASVPLGKPEKPSLRIGLPVEATSFLPVYVAQAKTWAAQGLDVSLVSFRGDAEVSQALIGDSVDINVQSTNGLINMINAGQPVTGFYAGFWQSDFAWLSVPSVKRWQDLKGKTVGVSTFGSLTDALTRYALRRHGLEPEKDVQIVQAGGTPSAYQALKAGRISSAIISPPFKWQGPEEGLNLLATESKDIAPEWPKHIFLTKTKFYRENPNTIAAVLRAHVAAIRLAKAQRDVAVAVMIDRLKYQKQWAERAYDDVINQYDEHGLLPDKYMPVFWQITQMIGDVKEPWPDAKLLDRKYVDSFKQWAP